MMTRYTCAAPRKRPFKRPRGSNKENEWTKRKRKKERRKLRWGWFDQEPPILCVYLIPPVPTSWNIHLLIVIVVGIAGIVLWLPQLQKKQTGFFTLRLPYRFKHKLFFFLSSMLQVWSMVNLEIKFQIRLSNGILMDCWPISCGMAACKSGLNTINFLGSVLKMFA